MKADNPFAVQSPEDISAQDALELFVDVFTDFHKVKEVGHCMVNGPRGCGKSMMFRYLLPDCQQLALDCSLAELPFLGVLVSIKNYVALTELRRLNKHHAAVVLNEHLLTLFVASKIFSTIATADPCATPRQAKLSGEYLRYVVELLRAAGWQGSIPSKSARTPKVTFRRLQSLCDRLYREAIGYVRRMTFSPGEVPHYSGPLLGYLDFIVPALDELRQLPFVNSGPVYLLIDDADILNTVQTRVLNSWISTRTAQSISIKLSTQLRYKTFNSTTGIRIESPHDYSEINIADIYTTSHSKYERRVREIVEKRLKAAGILNTSPEEFFPVDEEQEREVVEIGRKIKDKWPTSGRGHRASDDVLRYARPEYIARLGGKRKSGSKYSYSGFAQQVHLSSGQVRYFLEPAAQMFNEERASTGVIPATIRQNIQDEVLRRAANELMLTGYDQMFKEDEISFGDPDPDKLLDRKTKLRNLINALGGIFRLKLISKDSERRVFSVALSDEPDQDVARTIELGVQLGFFHKSTIGNKAGTGRTALYVLTRRLAPYFRLDPTGFAGYLFVTNERLRQAIADPGGLVRAAKSRGIDKLFVERQLQLFD